MGKIQELKMTFLINSAVDKHFPPRETVLLNFDKKDSQIARNCESLEIPKISLTTRTDLCLLFAEFRDRRLIAYLLDVGLQVQQPDSAFPERPSEGRFKVSGLFDRFRPAAVSLGEQGEIGIGEVGPRHALRVVALLVHPDRAVA